MTIQHACFLCGQEYQLDDSYAGKTVRCKACQGAMEVAAPKSRSKRQKDELEEIPEEELAVTRSARRSRKKGSNPRSKSASEWIDSIPGFVWVGAGVVGAMVFVIVGVIVFNRKGGTPAAPANVAGVHEKGLGDKGNSPDGVLVPVGAATDAYDFSSIPIPKFPDLGEFKLGPHGGFVTTEVRLTDAGQPGGEMRLRLRMPEGEFAEKKLGCVLVGFAGTPMIFGTGLEELKYDDETLPYIKAGFAVCEYSMDGEVPGNPDNLASPECQAGYAKFAAAGAGVLNIRNAVDFVLAKVPQVSPDRLYIAGHSSAGSAALLGAAHDPRIKACIAYCAPTDLADQKAKLTGAFDFSKFQPDINEFFVRSSPMTHADRLNCPVYLFYARDDAVVKLDQGQKLYRRLIDIGRLPRLEIDASDDHFHSMSQRGIHKAVAWLKTLKSEQNLEPIAPPPPPPKTAQPAAPMPLAAASPETPATETPAANEPTTPEVKPAAGSDKATTQKTPGKSYGRRQRTMAPRAPRTPQGVPGL